MKKHLLHRNSICLSVALACWALQSSPSARADNEKTTKPEGSSLVTTLIATQYGGSHIHQVSSDGNITPFKLPAGSRWGEGSYDGSNDPLLSPDRKLLAFVHKGSLLLRPMPEGKTTTVVGGYPDDEILITGWSPDGMQLVYFLGPSAHPDGPFKITKPQHFVYDLKAKKSRKITLAGSLWGWFSGGEMLLHDFDDFERSKLLSQSLTPNTKAKTLFGDGAVYFQITLHPDGKRIAASRSNPRDTSSTQLVEVKLATGKITPLNKPGKWAEHQWPRWSPTGKRIAWITRTGMVDGFPQSVITVDKKPVTKQSNISDYEWLTDEVLVVVEHEGEHIALKVIDVTNGKVLGQKSTSP